jgi:hypothetical protein
MSPVIGYDSNVNVPGQVQRFRGGMNSALSIAYKEIVN